jgi:hypothetical protein
MDAVIELEALGRLYGCRPTNSILYDRLNVFILEGLAGLVTGVEIEYLSKTSRKGCATAEYVSVLIPRAEDKIVGLRDKEGLGIKLLGKREMRGNSLCDRVRGTKFPNYRRLISAPS